MEKGFFESSSNKIVYCYEMCKNCDLAIIILHGLAEHKGRYYDFMQQLKDAGISSFAMDLCGHGESSGTRGDVDGFNTFLTDLAQFINHITETFGIKRLVLFGHSLGGQIVASYSNSSFCAKNVEAVILSSPAISFGVLPFIFHLFPYRLCGKIKIKKRHSESKEMLEYSKNDPLSCKSYSLRLLGTMFVDGKKQAKCCLKNSTKPTLILCGERDPLIKSNKLSKFFGKINNKNIKLTVYRNVKHRIVQNQGCESRIHDIIEWIRNIW